MKFLDNKLKFYPERINQYLNYIPANPITAILQVTNKCGYKCYYCDKKNNSDEMVINKKLMNRLQKLGIKSVIMSGGEPTLYPNFDQTMVFIKNYFKIGIVTTLCKYQKSLENIPDWVKVSLDTIDDEKYKKIKGASTLPKVINNIEKLYFTKNKNTVLGLQIVLCDENKNPDEIIRLYEKMNHICDYIQIRPIESIEPYTYSEDDYQNLAILKEKYPKFIISEKFYNHKLESDCYAKWVHLVVDTNHNILLCCNRINEVVANLYDKDLLIKIFNYKVNMKQCYNPCVMSIYNTYIKTLVDGVHKEFI